MANKVIKIDGDKVSIGKADGSLMSVDLSKLNFTPQVGDDLVINRTKSIAEAQATASNPAAKSKMAAGILGIFLGGFGIHNFYLGNTMKAIIQLLMGTIGWLGMLLFIPIPIAAAIWGLVEGILILTSKSGSNWHKSADGVELND
jgi:TM2 domain-containing membrane protein YozV